MTEISVPWELMDWFVAEGLPLLAVLVLAMLVAGFVRLAIKGPWS